MNISPISSIDSIKKNEANIKTGENRVSDLNGRKISLSKIEGEDKTSSCWDSINFDENINNKELIGAETFVDNPFESEDFSQDLMGDITDDDFTRAFEETIQMKFEADIEEAESEIEKKESEVEKKESEVEKKESEIEEKDGLAVTNFGIEEKVEAHEISIESKETKNISKNELENNTNIVSGSLENSFVNFLKKNNLGYQDQDLFKSDFLELKKILDDSSTDNHESITQNFINKIIVEGKIGKLVNGKFVPLNQKEQEQLKQQLTGFFQDYFIQYPLSTTKVETTSSTQSSNQKLNKDPDTYVVAHYTSDKQVFSQSFRVQVLIKSSTIANIIIDIIKKGQESALEERKRSEKKDLQDRILEAVIKSDILKAEILKSTIKVQSFKIEATKTINMPLKIEVKFARMINNSNRTMVVERASLQLPGIHKIKPLVKATA